MRRSRYPQGPALEPSRRDNWLALLQAVDRPHSGWVRAPFRQAAVRTESRPRERNGRSGVEAGPALSNSNVVLARPRREAVESAVGRPLRRLRAATGLVQRPHRGFPLPERDARGLTKG